MTVMMQRQFMKNIRASAFPSLNSSVENYFRTGREAIMADTIDLEFVELIRNYLYQRGDQGATMNDLFREVDMDLTAVYDVLIYMQDKGEAHYKQKMGYMTWYLKDAR
jgi:hypothetical protein